MAFMNQQEHEILVEDIAKSLRSNKPKKVTDSKPEDRDEEKIGAEIPLDKVLPPSDGHETGLRTPTNSANNQPYKGGLYIEDLETRLCRLLEALETDPKASVSANQSADVHQDERSGQSQVGTTEVLGHSKAKTDPSTPAKAQQQENSPFAARGKGEKKAEEEEEKSSEDQLKGALSELGTSGEANISASA